MANRIPHQRLLALAVLLGLSPWTHAEPPKVALATGMQYSDNVRKTPNGSTEEWTSESTLKFEHKASRGRLDADIAGEVTYENYLNNSFKDRTTTELRLDGVYQFNRQFGWLFDDKLSDVPQDRALPDTPDNSVQLNILKTGPKYTKYWNQRNFTDLIAEFVDVAYEGRQVDSQRVRGGVVQNWLSSPTRQFGLEAFAEQARIDDAAQTDTSNARASVLVGKEFRNGSWLAKVGYTNLTREVGGEDKTDDGPTGLFSALYKVTGKADFSFEVERVLSDSASDQILNYFDELRVVTFIDVVTQNRGRVALDYELSKRDRYVLSYTTISDDYLEQQFKERTDYGKMLWRHSHTPRLLSELSLTYEKDAFSDTGESEKTWISGYQLSYFLFRQFRVAAYVRFEDGKNSDPDLNYDDLVGGMNVSWISRK